MGSGFQDVSRDVGFEGVAGVEQHQIVQHEGISTELITTKNAIALNEYLQEKGLAFPETSQALIDQYVGEDYSFVITYIHDYEAFRNRTAYNSRDSYQRRVGPLSDAFLSVYVSFPTHEIYFPLKLTSVYGEERIPIALYISGHITPNLYTDIRSHTKIEYYDTYGMMYTQQFLPLFNNHYTSDYEKRYSNTHYYTMSDYTYTKVRIDAPSHEFTEDLWISTSTPIHVQAQQVFTRYSWVWGIAMYVVISLLSSLLAGLFIYKDRYSHKKYVLHGLWNCLTFIGLLIATIVRFEGVKKLLYIVCFYGLFTISIIIVTILLHIIL